MKYSRRQLLRAAALGGGLVAGELWIPGAKLISLPPPPRRWIGRTIYLDETLLLRDGDYFSGCKFIASDDFVGDAVLISTLSGDQIATLRDSSVQTQCYIIGYSQMKISTSLSIFT